jgi:hypothetical protein
MRDCYHHHAWNQEAQIRPNTVLAAKLLVGRYELLVDVDQRRRLLSCGWDYEPRLAAMGRGCLFFAHTNLAGAAHSQVNGTAQPATAKLFLALPDVVRRKCN